MDLMTPAMDFREYRGNAHFMKQLHRVYNFPVLVYKINEDATRDLLRIEDPSI